MTIYRTTVKIPEVAQVIAACQEVGSVAVFQDGTLALDFSVGEGESYADLYELAAAVIALQDHLNSLGTLQGLVILKRPTPS